MGAIAAEHRGNRSYDALLTAGLIIPGSSRTLHRAALRCSLYSPMVSKTWLQQDPPQSCSEMFSTLRWYQRPGSSRTLHRAALRCSLYSPMVSKTWLQQDPPQSCSEMFSLLSDGIKDLAPAGPSTELL
ncbi:hypothetical protein NHX12_009130 [Muraenolepis orangiensis]|uniref:Uncharacterized protein n=1 Tax=Muraenolepis orangiensis TaxID=630683 RepID=A0A9Q0DPF8_9TELE|nr:hypothetical protein NHX12_009130 [Muraenolepis orangiensis]